MAPIKSHRSMLMRNDHKGKKSKFNVFSIDPLKSVAVLSRDAHSVDEVRVQDTHGKRLKRKKAWEKAVFGWHSSTENLKHVVWASFIGAFLIPHYRPEWESYAKWTPITHAILEEDERKKRQRRKSNFRSQKNQPWYRNRKTVKSIYPTVPRPLKHNHSMCMPVRINVSGEIFEPQLRTLCRFPNTLLGDQDRLIQFYDPSHDEYFFDRHRTCFEAIIYYYNTGGILRRPTHVPLDIFLQEVKFFDLGPELLAKFSAVDDEEVLPKNLLKKKLWLLMENPQSSHQAQIFAYLSIFAVCLAIFIFCVETLPMFEGGSNGDSTRDPFFLVETVCVMFFIFEYIMRLLSCPNIFQFLRGFSNFVDLMAVVPYFISFLHSNRMNSSGGKSEAVWLTVLRTFRLMRVFRIMKLSRHNRGLKILGKTLKASRGSLLLLIFFLAMGVVIFSSVMYIVEWETPNTCFTSIPEGFWFSVVTMTTLGVGDIVPKSVLGKVVGAVCAITGVLTISLPVPVIVSHFTMFYNSEEIHNPTSKNNAKMFEYTYVEHCPYYPAWYAKDGKVVNEHDPSSIRRSTGSYNATVAKERALNSQWLVGEVRPGDSDSDFERLKWVNKSKNKHVEE